MLRVPHTTPPTTAAKSSSRSSDCIMLVVPPRGSGRSALGARPDEMPGG
jgi:hypothetical protein